MWVQESAGVTHCVCVHLLSEASEAALLRGCEETAAVSNGCEKQKQQPQKKKGFTFVSIA